MPGFRQGVPIRKVLAERMQESVPGVRYEANVVGIACGDMHFSHSPPVFRSAEPDWYAAQARQIKQLRDLRVHYRVPVFCTGDVFHKWNSPPELINFLISELPRPFYSVPGNHDLPNHSQKDIHKSAYYTLATAGRLTELCETKVCYEKGIDAFGIGYGEQVTPNLKIAWAKDFGVKLAVIHAYVYADPEKVPEPLRTRSNSILPWIRGLDSLGVTTAIFGDNHAGFHYHAGNLQIMNCGTFMIRNADEVNYKPRVGLIYSDGTIQTVFLDTSEDKYLDQEKIKKAVEQSCDMAKILNELSEVEGGIVEFDLCVREYMKVHKVDPKVQKIILAALEGVK